MEDIRAACTVIIVLTSAVLMAYGGASPLTGVPPASQTEPSIITEDDNGRNIRLRRGDIIEIRLKAQFGTGYRWEPTKLTAARLRLISRSVVSAAPGDESGYETQVFRFVARSAGNFTLRLDHMRPWEKGVEPTKTFSISGKIVSVRHSDRRRKSKC